jgi:hypothetical protein
MSRIASRGSYPGQQVGERQPATPPPLRNRKSRLDQHVLHA